MNYPGNDPAILLIELQHIKFRCVLDSRKCIYICAWYLNSGQIKTAIKNHVREKNTHHTLQSEFPFKINYWHHFGFNNYLKS